MNFALIGAVIAACLIIFAIFTLKKLGFSKMYKTPHAPTDPAAQAAYSSSKHQEETKKLTIKEKLELSWKFLYEITEVIVNKFSKQDKEEVKQMGEILAKNGVRYNHSVDLAIAPMLARSKTRSQDLSNRYEGVSI